MSKRWGREFWPSKTRVVRAAMGNWLGVRMNSTGRGYGRGMSWDLGRRDDEVTGEER